MIRILLLLLAAALPEASRADPVPVRSGEHADFSRLVLLIEDVPEWRFGRVEGGYEMRPEGVESGYDLSRVFDFIPRSRIVSVDMRPGGRLFLHVSCDCHGDAFEIRNGLVIDIKDGAADSRTRFEARLPEPAQQPANTDPDARTASLSESIGLFPIRFAPSRTQYAWHDRIAMQLPAGASAPPPNPGAGQTSDPGDAQAPGQAASEPDPPGGARSPDGPDGPEGSDGARQTLADAQATLLAQISRAAAQGLVEPDLKTGPGSAQGGQADAASRDTAAPGRIDAEPGAPVPNMAVQTAVDQGTVASPRTADRTPEGDPCIPSDQLDVARWGDPANPGAQLGAIRSATIGEFDAADPESIERLAQAYLYLTFGAEARALLQTYPQAVSSPEIYRALADIMDNGFAKTPDPLRDQLACDTRAALWALLARPSLGRSDRVATKAVLAAFGELPLHLRRHLGPEIAQRFLAVGDAETARAIRDGVTRAPGDPGPALRMVEAEISISQGHEARADESLMEIAGAQGPLAPQAVIRLIDTRAASGREIPDDILQTAEALAFEHRGTELGADLTRAALRAMIARGQILPAQKAIAAARDSADLTAVQAAVLRQRLFHNAVEAAADDVFLQAALAGPLGLGSRPTDGQTRRAVAARLLDLGFPEPARKVLSETDAIPGPEDRMHIAKAYLIEDRPDLAIGYLAGLTGQRALQLQARAHSALLDFGSAAVVYTRIGADQDAASALWRARSWADADRFEPGIRRTAAAFALRAEETGGADRPDPDATAGPLQRNRALIGQSRETRAILTELLQATPRP